MVTVSNLAPLLTMEAAILILLFIIPLVILLRKKWSGKCHAENLVANTEVERAKLDLERARLEQENETSREKTKLELEIQRLERELDSHTKLEMKKLELEREKILKEIELSKLTLEMERMKEAYNQETLSKEHERDRETQKMEFEVTTKMIDKGYDPFDLAYATAGVSRTLRNDKSDNDLKYLREIARQQYAILKERNLLQIAGASSTSTSPPLQTNEEEKRETFKHLEHDLLDCDSGTEENYIQVEAAQLD